MPPGVDLPASPSDDTAAPTWEVSLASVALIVVGAASAAYLLVLSVVVHPAVLLGLVSPVPAIVLGSRNLVQQVAPRVVFPVDPSSGE